MRSNPCSGRLSRGRPSYLVTPDRPEQHRVGCLRERERRVRQRIARRIVARAADRCLLELDLQPSARERLQDLHRLRDDLGTDAVAGQHRDFHVFNRK